MAADTVAKVKKSKPFTALDAVVVAVIIALAVAASFAVYRLPASVVTVAVDGRSASYPLGENAEIKLDHLTVHIADGEVWVTDADCADKTCVHTGRISRAGQSIVCLPNGIVVSICGEGDLAWELGR